MLFEVIQSMNGKTMMYTDDRNCIDFEILASQEASGYYFKVDGKKTTAKQVKAYFDVDARIGSFESNITPANNTVRKVRPVICLNNHKTYSTMSEAGKDLGIDSALISYSLKVGRPTKGYSFAFAEE